MQVRVKQAVYQMQQHQLKIHLLCQDLVSVTYPREFTERLPNTWIIDGNCHSKKIPNNRSLTIMPTL